MYKVSTGTTFSDECPCVSAVNGYSTFFNRHFETFYNAFRLKSSVVHGIFSRWCSSTDKTFFHSLNAPFVIPGQFSLAHSFFTGIDFMKESKLTLDFDQKSLIIPDDQIKQLPKVEKPVEIDLSDTKRDNLVALHFKYDQARRRFIVWAQNEIAVVPDFHKRILFSDEAHFWLNGYVNKQNCRIWSEANPQVYVETPLHPEKLTVWCTLWAGGIIGPYFFKNDEGHNELGFQQDGATCHTARATIDLLKDTFGNRLISRFGPVNWPPRSCDITPLDYFLWGYVKSLVYADKPQTLDHLEDNIRRVITDIRPQMLEKVIENWTSRLDYIRASRGSPMPEIIFKM
ncbi:DUF4817 domain-containing protein [Trichonephila clavipes]|nr:DUF4817 domain-containing protein [Trichonephila clavipes]